MCWDLENVTSVPGDIRQKGTDPMTVQVLMMVDMICKCALTVCPGLTCTSGTGFIQFQWVPADAQQFPTVIL